MRAALVALAGAAILRGGRTARPRVLHTTAWWQHTLQAPNTSWAPITGPGYLVPVFDGNGTANSTNATNATVTTPAPLGGPNAMDAAAAGATVGIMGASPVNGTNASNVSNWTDPTYNLTINASYPSPPPYTGPTIIPGPRPVLSWPIGPNPQTAKEREAMWHTLTAKEGAQYVHAHAADMNERLINASIETETILTGRHWGTPAPEAPHRPKLHELIGPVARSFPVALRRALSDGLRGLNASGIIKSAAANVTAAFAARLGSLDASLAPVVWNNSNASNCTPWPNATNGTNVTPPTAPPEKWPPTAEYHPPNASTTPGPLGATAGPFGTTPAGTTPAAPTAVATTPMPMLLQHWPVPRFLRAALA